MSKFELVAQFNNNRKETSIFNINAKYYDRSDKKDKIEITNNLIRITGERTNISNDKSVLLNTQSTICKQLMKSIAFTYFLVGRKLFFSNVYIIVNNYKIDFNDYLQNEFFRTKLSKNELINIKQCKFLFNIDKRQNNMLLVAYTNLIVAINNNDFDYYWKAFNSIYSIISEEKKEDIKLRDVRSFISKNWKEFNRTNKLLGKETYENIRKLRIQEFIYYMCDSINKINNYYDMIKSFTDWRIIKLFEETLPYREKFLNDKGLLNDIKDYIYKAKRMNIKNNVDIARFYILKYSYFLRNKYFHGEKTFQQLLFNFNSELDEINRINKILKTFLIDLLNLTSRFI